MSSAEVVQKNTAKDKEQYVCYWSEHINQIGLLRSPFLSSNQPGKVKEIKATIERLKALVSEAADIDFPDEAIAK